MSQRATSILIVIGRVGLASLFILGGLNKILNYTATLEQMRNVGIPMSEIVLPLVILLEAGGGILVAFALPLASLAALVLAGYTIVVNLVFHPFWAFTGQLAAVELSLFFKNISVAGGLLYVSGMINRHRERISQTRE